MSLRILFVSTGLGIGGAERTLQRLVIELARRGHQLCVCSLGGGGVIGEELAQQSVEVRTVRFRKRPGDLLKLGDLHRIIKSHRPDIVQTWMYHADLAGGLMARWSSNAPVVWGVRQSNLDTHKSKRVTRWVVAANARLSRWIPAHVIYCAIAAARVHRRAGYVPKSEQVIQNGCDTTVFKRSVGTGRALRQQWGAIEGTPVIGHAGRWDAQKDYSTLVIAMNKIAGVLPEAIFVLVGPGIDEQNRELLELLRETGLQRVRLLGVSNDMVAFYSSLDCLIMSSAYGEGFPNVLVEAMACEVPCVATDVGDSVSIVGSTGCVVPVQSPDNIAGAVLDIIKMAPGARRALGVAARGSIVGHFSFEHMVDQYEAVYAGLVEQGQY